MSVEAARAHLTGLGLSADLRCADAIELRSRTAPSTTCDDVVPRACRRPGCRAARGGARARARSELTAIEVDYNTVWATPATAAFDALFAAVAERWTRAGAVTRARTSPGGSPKRFASVDPGELRLNYTGPRSTVSSVRRRCGREHPPALAEVATASASQLEAGLADLRALPSIPTPRWDGCPQSQGGALSHHARWARWTQPPTSSLKAARRESDRSPRRPSPRREGSPTRRSLDGDARPRRSSGREALAAGEVVQRRGVPRLQLDRLAPAVGHSGVLAGVVETS